MSVSASINLSSDNVPGQLSFISNDTFRQGSQTNMQVTQSGVSATHFFPPGAGRSIRGHTDSFGNKTYRDNHGNTVRETTDSLGNTTYRDNRGNVTRCRTDSLGNEHCR